MSSAVDPLRDPARLRAIHEAGLQDDSTQETFDRLTRLVSRCVRAPLVMINLIDERRQLTLSCVVPSTWRGEREATLQDSFCRHAVVAREPLLIEDTHRHPLVSSSQITTALGVRSYLGFPLITSGGHALGTICVADFEPRRWTDDEVRTLGDLAASAVTEIELRLEVARQRQLQDSLRESEARFRAFVDSVQDYAILMLDAEGCILGWSRGAKALTGYLRDEVLGHHFSTLLPAGHEQADRAERLAMAALTRGPAEEEGWMLRKGATPFWGSTAVTALRNHDGELIGYAMLTRDLTERRRAEAALRDAHAALEERVEERTEFLNAMLESLAEGIVACDAEGRLTLFNRATREFHGLPPAPLPPELHAEHYSLYHPDGTTPMEHDRVPLLRALKGEVVRDVEMVIAPRGREPRRLLANGRAIFNAQGEKLGAVVAMHDITERALAEQELLRLSRRQELILQTAADGIIGIDAEGRATFVNPAGARMLGHEVAELVGQPVHALVHHSHPDGSPYPWDECPIHATIRDGTPRQVDHDVLWRRAGAPFPAEYTSSPLMEDGRVTGAVVTFRDVTGRLRIEEHARALVREQAVRTAAEEAERRIADILESITGVFFAFDREWRVTYANSRARELTERPREELVGRNAWEVSSELSDTAARGALQRAMSERVAVALDFPSVLRPGSWFHLHAAPTSEGVATYIRDVTERKEAEEALRAAKDEAERANRAKSEFLSRMSHELRTPLNAILGFGQILEMDVRREEDQESVEHILKAGQHLLRLIDEVLDISRIEAGQIGLSVEPVSVRSVLQESLDLVRLAAAKQTITLRARDALAEERFVRADQQRLKQVLLNLLSNAIKYNRPGGFVTLSCENAGEHHLRIAVQDTGFGISAEKLQRLFTPFERLGADQTPVEGTGLGLALSRGLAEGMGGSLGVESVPGEGSRFWVELPIAPSPAANEPVQGQGPHEEPGPAAGAGSTILFIEDNLANVRLMERVFEHRPRVRLLTAMQGTLGVELAREHRPDLILLDIDLPDLPGDIVLLQIRQDPALREIPVVMVSGDATPAQVRRVLDLGAQGYVTKPFDIQELLRIIDENLPTD